MPARKTPPTPGNRRMQENLFTLLLVFTAVLVTGGLYWWTEMRCPDPRMVTITTDRPEYTLGETVEISIRNTGDGPVDIFCPSSCALGNFPTAMERLVDGRWEYSSGFCPSIGSPLENRGTVEGDFIRHTLAPGGSFQVGLSNLGAMRLDGEESFRVVYSLCHGRVPVYSGVFTIRP
jgi:hypothetical protein